MRSKLRLAIMCALVLDAASGLSAVAQGQQKVTQLRIWTDSTGRQKVEAAFVELKDGVVTLKRADGRTVTVPIERLSKGDQQFATSQPPLEMTPTAVESTARQFADFQTLASGVQRIQLLPGRREFIFSMYEPVDHLKPLRELVRVMREQNLGNGFDFGPYPRANTKPLFDYLATVGWPIICSVGPEMQIRGGRAVLGREAEAALAAVDRAGLFMGAHLGEWDEYFYHWSQNEPFWRNLYGKEFNAFKHLMKPAGLKGYDRRPRSRKECYDAVKDYFMSRQRDLLNRVVSLTGHSHYEAYAGEWGARCIGLEVGEDIAFTQSKLAFARGASRQWQTPWSVQVSPWFSGACTISGALRREGAEPRGLDAGHSLSFYERMWLHGWFAGTAMVTPENSLMIFFEYDHFDKPQAPWTLTSHGRKAAEVFRFMQTHERGIPYTPVAIVLDHLAGYNAAEDRPWAILEPTEGDQETRDLFDLQLFPGSDHVHVKPNPANPEASYLRPTPFGEMFDVLLTNVRPELLSTYPAILLAGDIEFDQAFLVALKQSLRGGSRVLMSPRHRTALGEEFRRLTQEGSVEVLMPWTNPATGRPAAISNERLRRLTQQYLPVEVTGAVQYQINRTPAGWVIELINNLGVIKRPDRPAVIDARAIARVRLKPHVECRFVREWRSLRTHDNPSLVDVELGPGGIEYVEFTNPAR